MIPLHVASINPTPVDQSFRTTAPAAPPVSSSRTIERSALHVFAAISDPWSLVLLVSTVTPQSIDDAPSRLRTGDTFTLHAIRWNMPVLVTISVTRCVVNQRLEWTAAYSVDGRPVISGEHWSATVTPATDRRSSIEVTFEPPEELQSDEISATPDSRLRTRIASSLRAFDNLLTTSGSARSTA